MTNKMDLADYLSLPRVETAALIALAQKLLVTAPKPLMEALKKPLKRLQVALDELRTVYSEQGTSKVADRRAADSVLDAAWGALYRRLSAAAELPAERYPIAMEAANLLERIFPGGLAFLKHAFDVEWTESDQTLRLIADQGLEAALKRAAGEPFLTEVRRAHEEYGLVLGVTKASKSRPKPSLSVPYEATHAAIRAYARRVVGSIDEDDEDGTPAMLAALAPIAELRVAMAQRRAGHEVSDPAEPPPADRPDPPAPESTAV